MLGIRSRQALADPDEWPDIAHTYDMVAESYAELADCLEVPRVGLH